MTAKCSWCERRYLARKYKDNEPFEYPLEYCSQSCYDAWKKESWSKMKCPSHHKGNLYLVPHRDYRHVRAWCVACKNNVHLQFVGAERALDMLSANGELWIGRDLLASSIKHSTEYLVLRMTNAKRNYIDYDFVIQTWAFRACCNLNSTFAWPPAFVHLKVSGLLDLPDKFDSSEERTKCIRKALPQWQVWRDEVTITSYNRHFSTYHLIEGLRQTLGNMLLRDQCIEEIVNQMKCEKQQDEYGNRMTIYMLPKRLLWKIACVYVSR